jgi:hypothetical protein
MDHSIRRLFRTMMIEATIAAGLLMGVTACHAGSSGSGGGKLDACSLVSAAEAGKILGAKVTVHPTDTSGLGPGAASLCGYTTGRVLGGFLLRVAPGAQYTDLKEGEPGPKLTFADVKGLGKAAYLTETRGYFMLNVLGHGTYIMITIDRGPNAANIAQAEKLARVALGHLK